MPTASPRRESAVGYLLSRIDYERVAAVSDPDRDFRLDRMRELLRRLGNPQDRLKIVHVAGTKGKGSTSAMLASMLKAAGYRAGLYTSPHLERLEERIQVDGVPCSADELIGLIDRVRPVVEQLDHEGRQRKPAEAGPTYFDITTAMALLHFAQAGTDIALMEVGLGGRLDSTNVCRPMVSVITSISFDHTQQLGSTLAAIAREKAGIVKPGVPVVSGVTEAEPRNVIQEVAAQQQSPLRQLEVDFHYHYHPPRQIDAAQPGARGTIDFESTRAGSKHCIHTVELGLLGRHQAANAAVALAVAAELERQGLRAPEVALRQGLAAVRWPARIEIMSHHPTVIVDAAHNTASTRCLLETLDESFRASGRLLILATTQDKDLRGMLELLLPRFEAVILTRYTNNPRAVSLDDLDAAVAELSPIPRHVAPDPRAAWALARQLISPEHLVCVAGSFFLAAQMRAEIAAHPATISDTALTAAPSLAPARA